jgi:hypothetical protein
MGSLPQSASAMWTGRIILRHKGRSTMPAAPAHGLYQASSTVEWKLMTVRRSRSRTMTPSLPTKGPVTAR